MSREESRLGKRGACATAGTGWRAPTGWARRQLDVRSVGDVRRVRVWQDLAGFGVVLRLILNFLYVLHSWVTSHGTRADR